MQNQSEIAISKLIDNLFIFFINNLYEFALFSQILNIIKLDIEIIHCCLGHLNVDSIIKLISMSTGIEIPNSISKFFYEIYVLIKQAKHISKNPAIRTLLSRKRIYTNLVGPIILIRYNGSNYGLLLTNNVLCITTKMLFKNKN